MRKFRCPMCTQYEMEMRFTAQYDQSGYKRLRRWLTCMRCLYQMEVAMGQVLPRSKDA